MTGIISGSDAWRRATATSRNGARVRPMPGGPKN
jgi:hypothetical protein